MSTQELVTWKELALSADKSSENEYRTRFLDRMVKAPQYVWKVTSESE